ncbi:MAG: YiiX family permuted papain-like enzyme [Aquabacterium sp.]|jgi:uncharacterized protein YycO
MPPSALCPRRAIGIAWVLAAAGFGGAHAAGAYTPRAGDIVFHTSTSSQSRAVQAATGSRYSHMGVVLRHQGQWQVFEAVQPVKYTPLPRWIARGAGHHVVVKRLRQPLTASQQAALQASARPMVGLDYDLTFEWSDKRLYCSELVWKLYDTALGIQLTPLAELRSFDLRSPVVQQTMKERYGSQVPLSEPVVAPVAIFDSPLLDTVYTQ